MLEGRNDGWIGGFELGQLAKVHNAPAVVGFVSAALFIDRTRLERIETRRDGHRCFYRLLKSKGQLELV